MLSIDCQFETPLLFCSRKITKIVKGVYMPPVTLAELRQQPEHQFGVLPRALFAEFFHETEQFYGLDGIKNGLQDIKERAFSPLTQRFNRGYFFMPFGSKSEFGWSVMAGPCAAAGYATAPSLTMSLLCIPAIGELVIGIGDLLKGIKHKMAGSESEASACFRNGLTRIALSPCLALTSLLAIPLEVARFITRSIITLIDVIKRCLLPSVKKDDASQANDQGLTPVELQTAGAEAGANSGMSR
jgi:hypothetical protein